MDGPVLRSGNVQVYIGRIPSADIPDLATGPSLPISMSIDVPQQPTRKKITVYLPTGTPKIIEEKKDNVESINFTQVGVMVKYSTNHTIVYPTSIQFVYEEIPSFL